VEETKDFLTITCSNLHMQTLYPIKYWAGNKFRYGFYIWSESWKDTDDFFFIWEKTMFKPYYRNKIYGYQNGDWVEIYPDYHYKPEEFEKALWQFVDSLPLTYVVIQGKRMFLLHEFKDGQYAEYWAFNPIDKQIYYAFAEPKKSSVKKVNTDAVKQLLYEYLLNKINERAKFADIHTQHLIIIKRGQK